MVRQQLHMTLFVSLSIFSTAYAGGPHIEKPELRDREVQFTVAEAREAYHRKCMGQANHCFLFEQDLVPKGRPHRVLLFRGEKKKYDTVATSSYYRHMISRNDHCTDGCKPAQMIADMYKNLHALKRTEPGQPRFFRSANRTWVDQHGLEIPVGPSTYSGFYLLADIHRAGGGDSVSDFTFEGTKELFDPLVSFSASPSVARPWAGNRSEGLMIVASVPSSELLELDPSACQKDIGDNLKIYRITSCFNKAIDSELEYDAFLFLPMEYLLGVISDVNPRPKR